MAWGVHISVGRRKPPCSVLEVSLRLIEVLTVLLLGGRTTYVLAEHRSREAMAIDIKSDMHTSVGQ